MIKIISKLLIIIITLINLVYCGKQQTGSSRGGGSNLSQTFNVVTSTGQVVFRLCYKPGTYDQKLADAFFACYDQAPGKDLFVACQTRLFGGPLDSTKTIERSCNAPQLLPNYGLCIMKKFRQAGINMNRAVLKLNACQLSVLRRLQ